MEDLVFILPGVEEHPKQELVGSFAPIASLPMYEDKAIKWFANDRCSRKAARHIERKTGINFERTRDISEAEIISRRGYPGNPLWAGVAAWAEDDPVWRLKTRRGKKYMSTVLHEFCHALGMDHPYNHSETRDTIMSYNRDRSRAKLYPKDIDILTGLYIEG